MLFTLFGSISLYEIGNASHKRTLIQMVLARAWLGSGTVGGTGLVGSWPRARYTTACEGVSFLASATTAATRSCSIFFRTVMVDSVLLRWLLPIMANMPHAPRDARTQ